MSHLSEKSNVFGNRLTHELLGLLGGVPNGNAARKIGGVGPVTVCALLDDRHVPGHCLATSSPFLFRPACFRMLHSVPAGKVLPGFPATVTSPGLSGWSKCWCDPVVRLWRQPCSSISLIISRTFIGTSADISNPERPLGQTEIRSPELKDDVVSAGAVRALGCLKPRHPHLSAASAMAVRSLGPPTTMSFRLAIGH